MAFSCFQPIISPQHIVPGFPPKLIEASQRPFLKGRQDERKSSSSSAAAAGRGWERAIRGNLVSESSYQEGLESSKLCVWLLLRHHFSADQKDFSCKDARTLGRVNFGVIFRIMENKMETTIL